MRSRNQKSRRIPAAFAAFRGQRSEPLGAASVRPAIPIVTVAVEAAVAAAIVAVAVKSAMPAFAAAEPMAHSPRAPVIEAFSTWMRAIS